MIDSGYDCPELLARCFDTEDWTLARFVDTAEAFMAEFVQLHPRFADIKFTGTNARNSVPLMSDLSNLRPWLLEKSWDRRAPFPYQNLDAQGRLTLQSRGSMGFKLSLTNGKSWDQKVDACIRSVGTTGTNAVTTLARKNHPEFQSGDLPMRLMALWIRHWPVAYASYGYNGWNEAVNFKLPPQECKGPFEVGWLTYFCDPAIGQWLPPEVKPQPLGPGVVFQLTPQMSRYDKPEDVALGLKIKAALDASGLKQSDLKPPP